MPSIIRYFQKRHWHFLKAIAERCQPSGGHLYLVGGSVRSALLKEPVLDFDVEVFGLPAADLERILGEFATVTRVGKSFGIFKLKGWPIDVGLPRREQKSGLGHRGFEVEIDPDMTILEAAWRRDFTVNALYFEVTKRRLIDPLNGRKDLEQGLLRHCSERFPEDPLRVLRGMQLAARLSAEVHPETIALCAGLTPEGLSPERFFGEWEKLVLRGRQPSRGLRFLEQCGWRRFFPELAALSGCPQDPRWHPEGDVWTHTLHCMDAFALNRIGQDEEDLIVGLAVLCHDMGKPSTTVKEGGEIRSHGHETAGLVPTRQFLERLNVSHRLIEQILPLVKCHMRPAILFQEMSSASAIRRLSRDCGRLDRLMRVFQADAAGRPPFPDDSLAARSWLMEEARRFNVQAGKPQPLLNGYDLMKRGWEQGPDLGRFLNAAYEGQLDGLFATREEALDWLDTQNSGKPEAEENQSERPLE